MMKVALEGEKTEILAEEGKLDYEGGMLAGLVSDEQSQDQDDCLDNLHYFLGKIDITKLKKENQALVQCMILFRDETGNRGVITEDVLVDMLISENVPIEVQVKYQELYHKYSVARISQAKFRYAVARFLQEVEEREYLEALNEAYTIYSKGVKLGKKELVGYKDSRNHLNKKLYEVVQHKNAVNIKEGDIREETNLAIDEMKSRKDLPSKFKGITTGIHELDDVTNGFQPGELVLVGGYTEVGKSMACLNFAHNACVKQGMNIAIGTAEVMYKQYRLRAYVRHSRNQDWGLPQGIEYKGYEKGTLTSEEQVGFEKAMEDFSTNPKYGRWWLFQIPKGVDLAWVYNKLAAYNSIAPLHAVFLDSLALMAESYGRDRRQVLNDMLREAKQMAVNFDNQRGIPIISPWHANRTSWEKALKSGFYTLGSWAEADELERSADILLWLLKLENAADTHEIQAGICKNRSGSANSKFVLYEDFASSYIGSTSSGKKASSSSDGIVGGVSMDARVRDLF